MVMIPPPMGLIGDLGNTQIAVPAHGVEIEGVESDLVAVRPVNDDGGPRVAQGQAGQPRVRQALDLLLGGQGKVRDVLAADYQAPSNRARSNEGIHHADPGEHAGAGIGHVKRQRMVQAEHRP